MMQRAIKHIKSVGLPQILNQPKHLFSSSFLPPADSELPSATKELSKLTNFSGNINTDLTHRILYSTDASAYKELPAGVVAPKSISDIQTLVNFATTHQISLIPRAAGTSLAGQVVGSGVVVDMSRYFNKILEVNILEGWVRVQPGVNREILNMCLKDHGLFFAPETASSNRCLLGGMVGNNSCGSHSIVYGSTRDHLLEVQLVLSNGELVTFRDLTIPQFEEKCQLVGLEGDIYRNIYHLLSNPDNKENIRREYPKSSINRRNTGYAIDVLMESNIFSNNSLTPFNFCKIISGSEGTLGFVTEMKLKIVELPPPVSGVIVVHLDKLQTAFHANLIALKYKPDAVELIDRYILDCTKANISQMKNRFFLEGDPDCLMIAEFNKNTKAEIEILTEQLIRELKENNYGYYYPTLYGDDVGKVWDLRNAGLGLLSNIPGDAKSMPLVEDVAVDVNDLPDYILDFQAILHKYNKECVYYAHIGAGELHLRPLFNMKDPTDKAKYRKILQEVTQIVKKYKGSLCGEHGMGRLRGEFIESMIGMENYEILKSIKRTWDPETIFNQGKVINCPKMDECLRYDYDYETKEISTTFDLLKESGGLVKTIEKCTGVGVCRKSEQMGGVMCPSFMGSATQDEYNSTRARLNLLREHIASSDSPFTNKEILEILKYCLACKGCRSECPASIDMSKVKAEYLQHYYDIDCVPFKSILMANMLQINRFLQVFHPIYNLALPVLQLFHPYIFGLTDKRTLPQLSKINLKSWLKTNLPKISPENPIKSIYFFCDEFSEMYEAELAIKGVTLLCKLGYEVKYIDHKESGRILFSGGYMKRGKEIANENIYILGDIAERHEIVVIEPSALSCIKDEYMYLSTGENSNKCKILGENTYLIEEFIYNEYKQGNIRKSQFRSNNKSIKVHCHCHQKALISTAPTVGVLELVGGGQEIKSGCCGMGGSFGYELDTYDLSMRIGELVLFPAVREVAQGQGVVVANGLSCRKQIYDGTGVTALSPIHILSDALI